MFKKKNLLILVRRAFGNCCAVLYAEDVLRNYRVHRKIFRGPSTLLVLLYTQPNLTVGLRRIAR